MFVFENDLAYRRVSTDFALGLASHSQDPILRQRYKNLQCHSVTVSQFFKKNIFYSKNVAVIGLALGLSLSYVYFRSLCLHVYILSKQTKHIKSVSEMIGGD
jgi:hypothetical protein